MTEWDLLNIAVFVWLALWCRSAVQRIAAGHLDSVSFAIIVHFIYCGIPAILDVLVGRPQYEFQWGFRVATGDERTFRIYSVYVSVVPVVLWYVGRSRDRSRSGQRLGSSQGPFSEASFRWLRPAFYLALVLPVLAVGFAPVPSLYRTYAAGPNRILNEGAGGPAAEVFHNVVVSNACNLSIIGGAGLILTVRRLSILSVAPIMPWLFAAVWIQGKRNTLAVVMVMLGFALWRRRVLRGRRLYSAGLAAVAIVMSFSFYYQSDVRDIQTGFSTAQQRYTTTRIDFSRDDRIKMSIYAELNPQQMQILEYRGQSVKYYALVWVPRSAWAGKPMPYAKYFTSAMLGRAPDPALRTSMTTSWLDEAIANFGWLGLGIGPLGLALISRLGDSRQNALLQLFTVLLVVMLQSVHLVAFFPLAACWLLLWLWSFIPSMPARFTPSVLPAGAP